MFRICFFVVLSFSLRLNGQGLKFENFTTKNGLISDDVYKVFQDKKGYIWLFTDYGAMKYNGKQFNQVLKNLEFNESFIYSYYENEKGQLWIANSNAKIYEVRNDSAIIVKGIEKISEKLKKDIAEIIQLYVDDSLNIFAVTKSSTYKFIKHSKYEPLDLNALYIKDSSDYVVLCDNNHLMPIISKKLKSKTGNYFLENKSITLKINQCNYKSKVLEIPSSVLTGPKLFKKIGKDIYMVFYNKIIKIDENKTITEIPLKSVITSYIVDKNNHLWVGCYNNGLFEIDEKNSIVNHYFNEKTVNDIFIDSQNGFWVTTTGFGLFHSGGFNTLYFDEASQLGAPVNLMRKIDEKIFVFNNQGNLFVIDDNNNIKSIDNQIKNEPLDFIKYHDLYLISFRNKTEFLDLKKGIVKVVNPLQKNFYLPYKYYLQGIDTLLLTNRNGFMIVCNDSLLKKVEFDFKVSDCVFKDNKVIIASDEGVYEYTNDHLLRPDFLKPTEHNKISKIVEDNFGNLWFCSKGFGLYKLSNSNILTHYIENSGLPSNIINDITFCTNHSILLSTNKGLFYGSRYKKWVQIYGEQVQSALELKNDIYLSTTRGLIIIKNINSGYKIPVYFNLASVLVNTQNINLKQLQKLEFNQNNIEFNFDIISPTSNETDIIYKLSGTKNQIGISKNQQIVLQGLSPGLYNLKVSLVASNTKSDSIVFSFYIEPAFWQTLWFKVFALLFCLGTCFFIGRELFKYYKKKEDKKNEISKLINEYKLIALKAQINPHFMSNCLTAIQHLIMNNKLDEANQYLAKFSFLLRQVLNFSTQAVVTLKDELTITELNIELEQLRFENKFDFLIEYNDDIDVTNILVPPLIFQPLVENAIWHGLLPLKKTRKGKLIIKIEKVSNLLRLIIEDNGIGRLTIVKDIGNLKNSKGIEITKQRISNLNVLNHVSSGSLSYEDLVDEDNSPIGTRAIIILPLITKYESPTT